MAIVVTLGAICLAHWGLLYRGMFIVTAAWDNNLKTCVVTATNPSLLKITFFFSMYLGSALERAFYGLKIYSSDGVRLRNLMFHFGGFDIETHGPHRSLEVTFPRWSCIFFCFFFDSLYPCCMCLSSLPFPLADHTDYSFLGA